MSPGPDAPPAWPDLLVVLPLTDAEAAVGGAHAVTVPGRASCGRCAGRGSTSPDDQPVPCDACGGRGLDPRRVGSPRCRSCDGLGRHMVEPCGFCDGRGVVDGGGVVTVTVPAEVGDGTRLRVAGAGGRVGAGACGDLVVQVARTGLGPSVPAPPSRTEATADLPRAELVDPAARRSATALTLLATGVLVLVGWLFYASA
ncbi:MAG: hypothetical protein KBG28_12025 [Kofleriaceae bacterium]|nr:hypothetical protein [Kofleriaceae bacterium]